MAVVPGDTLACEFLAKPALFAMTLLLARPLLFTAGSEREPKASRPHTNSEKSQKVSHCSAGFARRKAEYYLEVGSRAASDAISETAVGGSS